MDLGQAYDLQEIAFAAYPKAEDSIEDGCILTSIDGNNWTELCKIDRLATGYYFNYIDSAIFANENASICRYVKFRDDDTYVALSELKFYGQIAPEPPAPSAPTVQGTEQKPQTTGTAAPAVQATKKPSNNTKDTEQKVGQVKIKSVRSAKKRTVTIQWKKVNGAKGYRITYATNKNFRKGKKTINVKGTSKVIKKLKSGKKYYFKIEAYRGKTYGKASKVKSIKIK